MHCCLPLEQKRGLIIFISLHILSVPLASSTVFGVEHSYDKYLWKEVGREGQEGRKTHKSASHLWECQLKYPAFIQACKGAGPHLTPCICGVFSASIAPGITEK